MTLDRSTTRALAGLVRRELRRQLPLLAAESRGSALPEPPAFLDDIPFPEEAPARPVPPPGAPHRAGEPWLPAEVAQLRREWRRGGTVAGCALVHQRTTGAIASALKKHGIAPARVLAPVELIATRKAPRCFLHNNQIVNFNSHALKRCKERKVSPEEVARRIAMVDAAPYRKRKGDGRKRAFAGLDGLGAAAVSWAEGWTVISVWWAKG